MKKIFSLLLTIISLVAIGQAPSKIPLRADSIIMEKIGGNAEFVLRNGTRNLTYGYLQNIGAGKTKFRYVLDSVWIDGDSLRFRYGPATLAVYNLSGGGGPTYAAGYGLSLSGTTFKVDTSLISTKLWRQKGIDSINTYVSANYYTKTNINAFFGGTSVIGGYNKPNWDAVYTAYNAALASGGWVTVNRFSDSLAAHWAVIQTLAAGPFADMTKAVYDTDNDGIVDGTLATPTITYGVTSTDINFPRDQMSSVVLALIGGQPTTSSNIPFYNGANMAWNSGLAIRASNVITSGSDTLATKAYARSVGGGGSTSPAGNYGNLQLNRNSVFSTPASDSLKYTTSGGLVVKNFVYSHVGFSVVDPAGVNDASILTYENYLGTYGGGLSLRSPGGNTLNLLAPLSMGGSNKNLRFPNIAGTIANSVTVNSTNYTADANGVINIGTISGGGSSYTDADAITAPLTGFTLPSPSTVLATDDIISAIEKLQAQLDDPYYTDVAYFDGDGSSGDPLTLVNVESSFTETTEDFTGSTSLTLTLAHNIKSGKAVIVFYGTLPMENTAFTATPGGSSVVLSGLTRYTTDKIKVKYSY